MVIYVEILLIIPILLGILFIILVAGSEKSRQYKHYSNGIDYTSTPCVISPDKEILNFSKSYTSDAKCLNIKRIAIIYVPLLLSLIILLYILKCSYLVSIGTIFSASLIIISVLIFFNYKEYNFLTYVKSNFKTFISLKCLSKYSYIQSGFRKPGHIRFKGSLNYYYSNKKINMFGINIYKRSYFYSPLHKHDKIQLEKKTSPEFSGIYTIVNNVKFKYNVEIYSDLNEPNTIDNLCLSTNMYRVYTDEKDINKDSLNKVVEFLDDLYNKYGILFDIRISNNRMYLRSCNGCLIKNNEALFEKEMDFASNLQYFVSQNKLIELIVSITD